MEYGMISLQTITSQPSVRGAGALCDGDGARGSAASSTGMYVGSIGHCSPMAQIFHRSCCAHASIDQGPILVARFMSRKPFLERRCQILRTAGSEPRGVE
ncbi:hypothetical protein IF2G_00569 [Cordyceps javanica]|nr:hypothetical protein IF2G_00569 [Cordyceps javanica]